MFGYLLNGAQQVSDCLFVNHMYQELTELVGFSLDNCVMECGIPTFVEVFKTSNTGDQGVCSPMNIAQP